MNVNSPQLNKTNLDIKNTNNLAQQPSELEYLMRRIWTVVKFVFETVLIALPCLRQERTVYIYSCTYEEDQAGRNFLFWNSPWRYRLNIISINNSQESSIRNSQVSGPNKRVLSVRFPTSAATEEWLRGNSYEHATKQEEGKKILLLLTCPRKYAPLLRGPGWPELLSKGLIVYADDWRSKITDDFFE